MTNLRMTSKQLLSPLINQIREAHKIREDHHRAEKALTLRIKAVCRRNSKDGCKKEAAAIYDALMGKGDHPLAVVVFPSIQHLLKARDAVSEPRKEAEKELVKLASQLPVSSWVNDQKGAGLLTFGQIIGEAGDLGNYPNPAKLWKRMGLAVINGERQRKKTTIKEVKEHGYSPKRRAIMWNVGECFVKGGKDGPWRMLYLERKEFEFARLPEDQKGRKGYSHNRARRYVEKRFLRELWRQWHVSSDTLSNCSVDDN